MQNVSALVHGTLALHAEHEAHVCLPEYVVLGVQKKVDAQCLGIRMGKRLPFTLIAPRRNRLQYPDGNQCVTRRSPVASNPCTLHGFSSWGTCRQRTPRKTQHPEILQGLSWGARLLDQALAGGLRATCGPKSYNLQGMSCGARLRDQGLAGGLRATYGPKPYTLQGMSCCGARLRDQALAGGLRAARSPRRRRVAQAAPATLPPPRRPLLHVPAEPQRWA